MLRWGHSPERKDAVKSSEKKKANTFNAVRQRIGWIEAEISNQGMITIIGNTPLKFCTTARNLFRGLPTFVRPWPELSNPRPDLHLGAEGSAAH